MEKVLKSRSVKVIVSLFLMFAISLGSVFCYVNLKNNVIDGEIEYETDGGTEGTYLSKIFYKGEAGGTLTLPEEVKHGTSIKVPKGILYCGLYNDPDIKKIVFTPSYKTLFARSIYNLQNLEEVEFNEGLEVIGEDCFWDCPSLKSVTIPKSVKNIKKGAFADCTSLSKVIFLSNTKLEDDVFMFCSPDITFVAPANSPAIDYAIKYGFNYEISDSSSDIFYDVKQDKVVNTPSSFKACNKSDLAIASGSCTGDLTVFEKNISVKWKSNSNAIYYKVEARIDNDWLYPFYVPAKSSSIESFTITTRRDCNASNLVAKITAYGIGPYGIINGETKEIKYSKTSNNSGDNSNSGNNDSGNNSSTENKTNTANKITVPNEYSENMKFSWNKISGAVKYTIKVKNGNTEVASIKNVTSTSIKVSNLSKYKKYTIVITGYNKSGTKKGSYRRSVSYDTTMVIKKTFDKKPSVSNIEFSEPKGKNKCVKVTWKTDDIPEGYSVKNVKYKVSVKLNGSSKTFRTIYTKKQKANIYGTSKKALENGDGIKVTITPYLVSKKGEKLSYNDSTTIKTSKTHTIKNEDRKQLAKKTTEKNINKTITASIKDGIMDIKWKKPDEIKKQGEVLYKVVLTNTEENRTTKFWTSTPSFVRKVKGSKYNVSVTAYKFALNGKTKRFKYTTATDVTNSSVNLSKPSSGSEAEEHKIDINNNFNKSYIYAKGNCYFFEELMEELKTNSTKSIVVKLPYKKEGNKVVWTGDEKDYEVNQKSGVRSCHNCRSTDLTGGNLECASCRVKYGYTKYSGDETIVTSIVFKESSYRNIFYK